MSRITDDGTLESIVEDVLISKLMFYKLFDARIIDVNDPESLGRVKCVVPDLDWSANETAVWADMIQNGFFIPKVDDWVIVGFVSADENRAVCLGRCASNVEKPFVKTDGKNKQVIFEDSSLGNQLLFDRLDRKFKINESNPLAKGDVLLEELKKLNSYVEAIASALKDSATGASDGGAGYKTAITAELAKIINKPSFDKIV